MAPVSSMRAHAFRPVQEVGRGKMRRRTPVYCKAPNSAIDPELYRRRPLPDRHTIPGKAGCPHEGCRLLVIASGCNQEQEQQIFFLGNLPIFQPPIHIIFTALVFLLLRSLGHKSPYDGNGKKRNYSAGRSRCHRRHVANCCESRYLLDDSDFGGRERPMMKRY